MGVVASADDTGTGTAHGCSGDAGSTVTLTVNPDGIEPHGGCVQLTGIPRLRVVNNTNGFGQAGSTVVVSMRGLPVLSVARGASMMYPAPIGTYLAVGQHHGSCTCGSGVDLWVLP